MNTEETTNEELVKKYRETKDDNYRNLLIEKNLDFIKKYANSLSFYRVDTDDFFQESVLGFIDAIERFKENGHFLQCARFGMRKRIMNIFKKRKKEDMFREVTIQRDPNALKSLNPEAFCEGSFNDTGIDPDSEIYSSAPSMFYGTMVNTKRRVFSIGCDPFGKLHNKEIEKYNLRKLKIAFKQLNEEEKELIFQRYGFFDQPKTFRELSIFFEKTPQRIEQRQKEVEAKLRSIIKKTK